MGGGSLPQLSELRSGVQFLGRYTRGDMLRSTALRHYAEILKAKGFESDRLLADTGIDASRFGDTDYWLHTSEYRAIVGNMLSLSGDRGIGLDAGLSCDLHSLGVVGYAAQTCATMRESHSLWVELGGPLVGVLGRLVIVGQDSREVSFRLADEASFGPLIGFVVEETLSLIQATGRALVNGAPQFIRLSLPYAAPRHQQRYLEAFDCPVRFGARQSEIVVSRSWFEQDLRTRDAEVNSVFRRYCQELLRRASRRGATSSSLQRWLSRHDDASPPLKEAATGLMLSPRTLRRRLQEEGTSYRVLVDKERSSRAREYLRAGMCVADIASTLRFDNPASFRQAFRAWTGHSILEVQAQLRWRQGLH